MFVQRVLNPRRPDYSLWRNFLNLPADATPFEFLGRCEGRREGDAVRVTAPPRVNDHGEIRFKFVVHGVRHALLDARAQDAVSVLSTATISSSVRNRTTPWIGWRHTSARTRTRSAGFRGF